MGLGQSLLARALPVCYRTFAGISGLYLLDAGHTPLKRDNQKHLQTLSSVSWEQKAPLLERMQLQVRSESSQDLVRKAPFQTPPHIYSLRIPKDGAQESIYFNSVGDNTWTMFKNSSRTVKLQSTNREKQCGDQIFCDTKVSVGLAWWLSGKESPCQGRRHRFDP